MVVKLYKRRAGVSKPGAGNLYRHTTVTTFLGHASVVTSQGYMHIAVKKMSEDYQKFHPAVNNTNLYITNSHPLSKST